MPCLLWCKTSSLLCCAFLAVQQKLMLTNLMPTWCRQATGMTCNKNMVALLLSSTQAKKNLSQELWWNEFLHQPRLIDVATFSKVILQELFEVVKNKSVNVVVSFFFTWTTPVCLQTCGLPKWGVSCFRYMFKRKINCTSHTSETDSVFSTVVLLNLEYFS